MDGITNISSTPASPAVKKAVEREGAIKAPIDKNAAEKAVGNSDAIKTPIDEEAVKKAVEKANQAVADTKDKVSFDYDRGKGQLYVKVTDAATGRVVQTFPAGNFIEHMAATNNDVSGLLVNKKG